MEEIFTTLVICIVTFLTCSLEMFSILFPLIDMYPWLYKLLAIKITRLALSCLACCATPNSLAAEWSWHLDMSPILMALNATQTTTVAAVPAKQN